MTAQTPEKFVVGETVGFYHGEDIWDAIVTAVKGDAVTAKIGGVREMVFTPRADGKHVAVGTTPEFAVMPDMIFHPQPTPPAPVKATFLERVAKLFS